MFKVQFDLQDNFASNIYRKVSEGFINTVSVGFLPIEQIDNRYTKSELLELSFVPVPANPEAVVVMREMGLEPVEEKDLYKKPNLASETEAWDGPGEVSKLKKEELNEICAVDGLLPHHKAIDKKVVFRAVAQSMAIVMGAKTGIPIDKREAAYKHLAAHYKEFEKIIPSYDMVENQVLSDLNNEIHALTLDREEKHEVRLIKKIIKQTKQPKNDRFAEIIKALKVIDAAVNKIIVERR